MAVDNVPLNRPPSYEATTRNPSPENAVGSPGVYKGSVDEKEALHKGTMDSNLVLNSAYVGGEKSSLTGESRQVDLERFREVDKISDPKLLTQSSVDHRSSTIAQT